MRFETTETIATGNAEQVLNALEGALREFSEQIHREGNRIILQGLGPSPRSRNYRDTAVFNITPGHDSTTIHADITFQASALLGPTGQEDAVHAKLDYAFGQVCARLGIMNGFASTPEPESPPAEPPVLAEPSIDPPPVIEPISEPPIVTPVEPQIQPPVEPQGEPVSHAAIEPPLPVTPATPPSPLPPIPTTDLPIAPPVTHRARFVQETPVSTAKPIEKPAKPRVDAVPLPPDPVLPARRLIRDESSSRPASKPILPPQRPAESTLLFTAPEPARATNLPLLILGAFVLIAAGGFGYLYLTGHLDRDWIAQHNPFYTPASQPAQTQPAPTPQPETPAVIAPPQPPPPHTEQDPKLWLDQWADAMRGHDADLQASFYADPVQHYLGTDNVDHNKLIDDLSAAIHSRSGLWTFKMERVSLEDRTTNWALLRLTKHFMQLGDTPQITDRFVRTRIELRRTNGEWKIASETDYVPPSQPQQ